MNKFISERTAANKAVSSKEYRDLKSRYYDVEEAQDEEKMLEIKDKMEEVIDRYVTAAEEENDGKDIGK